MAQFRRVPARGSTPRRHPARGRLPLPRWLLAVLLVVFVGATGISSYLIFTAVRDAVAGWTITQLPGSGITEPTPVPGSTPGAPVIAASPEAWDGKTRVTILVMGIDHRLGEVDPSRTDSMILLTVDPQTKTAGMLSIPRDMWVDIPGFGKDKITTAHYKGEIYKVPGGGPALAVKTVQNFIGVPIPYFVRINFTAFETFIDQIGGIEVNNVEEINDPTYPDSQYGYEPFYLPAGPQHLGGHDALRYARTRATSGSDFDRARRQQEVILAVRAKVLNFNMLPTLIQEGPALYQTMADGILTNLSLEQMLQLARLSQEIPDGNIQSAVIDNNYIEFAQSPDGLDILQPIPEKIRELRDKIFASSGPYAPVVVQDSGELLTGEAAKVSVQNGTLTAGLAGLAGDYLKSKGVNVVEVTNADRGDYGTSVIIDYTGKPYTVRYLAEVLRVSQGNIFSGSDPDSPVDVVVIVGKGWQVPDS